MRKKILHVNQHNIRHNVKTPDDQKPVFTVKVGGQTIWGKEVFIDGSSIMKYSDKPLSCGARCWIETHSPVFIDGVCYE